MSVMRIFTPVTFLSINNNIYPYLDASVRLTSSSFSVTEGDIANVCVEGVLGSSLGIFEADLVVELSASPQSEGCQI